MCYNFFLLPSLPLFISTPRFSALTPIGVTNLKTFNNPFGWNLFLSSDPPPPQGGGNVFGTYPNVGGIHAPMQPMVQHSLSLIDYFPISGYPISGTPVIMKGGIPTPNTPYVAIGVPYHGHTTSSWGLPT